MLTILTKPILSEPRENFPYSMPKWLKIFGWEKTALFHPPTSRKASPSSNRCFQDTISMTQGNWSHISWTGFMKILTESLTSPTLKPKIMMVVLIQSLLRKVGSSIWKEINLWLSIWCTDSSNPLFNVPMKTANFCPLRLTPFQIVLYL